MKLIFEKNKENRRGFMYSRCDCPAATSLDKKYLRRNAFNLASVSELDVIRHYTNLSRLNFSVDTNFYPLV